MTRDEIILKSRETHIIEYDYSLVKDMKRVEDNIDIICPQHGLFHPRLSRFLKGSNCPYCINKGHKTTDSFKEEYIKKYNIYDLTSFHYTNAHTPSIAKCNQHGEFLISPTNLLNGVGCPQCKVDKLKHIFSSSKDEFICKAKQIHQDKYEYIGEYTNNFTPLLIRCNKCGNIFKQIPHNHLQGKGCPFCNQSHLEEQVTKILNENNIEYIFQCKFDWLGKQSLDFYLPKYNIAIECQGIQHFQQTLYGDVTHNQQLDSFKYELCKQHSIPIFYLLNQYIEDGKPSFYNEQNTLNSINSIYNLLHINPIQNDICDLLEQYNIDYQIIEEQYIKINNTHIYPILNDHIFENKNICNQISINNEKNGIKTIWVKQYEWEDTNKQEILKSFILTQCGIIKNRFYARNCYIKQLSNKDIKDFLIKNSMYGYRASSVVLGLCDKNTDELLMVYTFGHAYYGKGKYDIEVIRAATKCYTQVIGGATKLWSYFLKNYSKIQIGNKLVEWNTCVYYVDFDHNNGNSLQYLNFQFQYYTEGGFHNINKFTNKASSRNPNKNSDIKDNIKKDIIYTIPTSGTKVYCYNKKKS